MKRKSKLINLYLAYHLNKTFIILLIVIAIFLLCVIIINLGLPINKIDYDNNYLKYHINYIRETIYVINLLNSVIISFLISNELNSISTFDPMFVSNIKRNKILFSKIITNMILCLIIIFFEIILVYLFGVLFYPKFIIKKTIFFLIIYQILYCIELILIGEILIIIFNNNFISILIFLISMIVFILSEISNTKDYISLVIPILTIEDKENYFVNWNPIFYIGINLSIYLLLSILYQKKDINN